MKTPSLSPEVRVAMEALLNLIRLLGAELVAGRHRDDVDLLEASIREKLNIAVKDVSAEEEASGLAYVHQIISPVLSQIRAQAEAARKTEAQQIAGARKANRIH